MAVPTLDVKERSRRLAEWVAKTHRGKSTRQNPYHSTKTGQFAHGPGGGVATKPRVELPDGVAADLARRAQAPSGGFTVDPRTGTDVSSGYAVAIHPELSRVVSPGGQVKQALKDYVHDNPEAFEDPTNKFGAWHDPDTDQVWLDVSTVVSDRGEAVELGKRHNQIAIWDIVAGQEIPTGGTGR